MLNRYPYTIICGQGLGISYSSLAYGTTILSSDGFGQAKIKAYVNIANGNLVVSDHVTRFVEGGSTVEIGYIYNSKADKSEDLWRPAITNRFIQLPSTKTPLGTTAILRESDGHNTIYQQHPVEKTFYFAPGVSDGTPYLKYDYDKQQWIRYQPQTKITEYYDAEGYLTKREDAAGHVLEFTYYSAAAGQERRFKSVMRPGSDTQYEFRYSTSSLSTVEVYRVVSGADTLLQIHQFTDKAKTTIVPIYGKPQSEWYTITYQYSEGSSIIEEILQSDGTRMAFRDSGDPKRQITNILVGKDAPGSNNTRINYDEKASSVTLQDGSFAVTKISLDSESRVAAITRQQGYESATETTAYQYADKTKYSAGGQLSRISHPDSSKDIFEYKNFFGMLTRHIQPDGQLTDYFHDRGDISTQKSQSRESKSEVDIDNRPNVIVKAVYLQEKSKALLTRYVYDNDFDQSGHRFLRFEISPAGCVTEYRPNKSGYVESQRIYLKNKFDASQYPDHLAPSLSTMIDWTKTQDPEAIALTDYLYDVQGQLIRKREYDAIKSDGSGDEQSLGMGEEQFYWSAFGYLQKGTVKQDKVQVSETETKLDSLYRLISTTKKISDAQKEITQCDYFDAKQQVQITRPNGRLELKQLNTSGLSATEQSTVPETIEPRKFVYDRDTGGRPIVITGPDNLQTIQFYEPQQRLAFSITSTGLVTEQQYDDVNRYQATVRYINSVDIKQFYDGKLLPSFDIFRSLSLKADPDHDRVNYTFFDASGRIKYKVDENLAVVEFFYDSINRKVGEVAYRSCVTTDQLNQLKSGKLVEFPFDSKIDRSTRYSYDDDSHLVMKIDPAGYITEFKRDVAGRVAEKIVYDKSAKISQKCLALSEFKIEPSDKDAHTYYYYNARNQCIAEIDAENFYTAYTYLASGLKSTQVRYANPVNDPDWEKDKTRCPKIPTHSTEDQWTAFQYDLLERPIRIDAPSDKATLTQYEIMGHVTLTNVIDTSVPVNSDPDCQRATETQYDGWEQTTREANAYVRQLLTEVELDEKLTPVEKEAVKKSIWEEKSTRHVYDVTGLKLKTTNPLGYTTFYYYDKERRPVFIIDPTGAITKRTYNSFNEIVETRHIMTRLTAEILAGLTGGFLSDTLSKQLEALQNDKDPIWKFERDHLGLVTETIDPEKYHFKKIYNTFRECEFETHPLDEKSSITHSHKFDQRGLEVETKQESNGQFILETKEFANPFGKLTSTTDGVGSTTKTDYDRLARPTRITDPVGNAHTIEHDAFDRVRTEIDSLAQTTQHTYKQAERTHTITAPIAGVVTTTQTNVFDETIISIDALNKKQIFGHAPDGQIVSHQDALKNVTQDKYDLIGQHIAHIDPIGVMTTYERNGAGQVLKETLSADKNSRVNEYKLTIQTTYIRDALGRAIAVIDPRKVRRETTFDRCDRPLTTLTDPSSSDYVGLDLVAQSTYNGLGAKTSLTRGNTQQVDQSYVTFQLDIFNRPQGKIIDPSGLAITTTSRLNARGQVIAEVDPKNFITRSFYDARALLRFTVNPLGKVNEIIHNSEGQIIATRTYTKAIDVSQLTDATSLEFIEKWAADSQSQDDTLLISVRDAMSRECFTITQLGAVVEKRYDAASHEVRTIYYSTPMARSFMVDLTYEKVLAWSKEMTSPDKDHMIDRIFDVEGSERFTIDEEGYIKERCYDGLKRVISETIYVNKVSDRALIATLPADEVNAHLTKDSVGDCTTYTIYDLLGKPWFIITPAGDKSALYAVTRHDHDENGNLILTCQFANPISEPTSYDTLIATVTSLVPSPEKGDRLLTYEYDSANRTVTIIDATMKNRDQYKVDALGNLQMHIDRAGQSWEYLHDRAERLTAEISPTTTITQVTTSDDPSKKLIYTQLQARVQKKYFHDEVGNKVKIIEAMGTKEERTMLFSYDACRQLTSTEIADIAVYDEKKQSSFDTRPEKIVSLKTAMTFNAKQFPVAVQNENGDWTFTIYDADNHPIYKIDPLKGVIKNEYDIFGNACKEIRYATPIDLDVSQYTQTGIPQVILEQHLKTSPDGRITIYVHDKRGDWVSKQLGQEDIEDSLIVYCIPNEDGSLAECKKSVMKTNCVYDAKRKLIFQAILIGTNYSETVWWRDRSGEVIAESRDVSNPLQQLIAHFIKRYKRNVFKEEIQRIEYSNPIKQSVKELSLVTLDDLLAQLPITNQNRTFLTDYDKLGQKTLETRVGIVIQQVRVDESGMPHCDDLPRQNLIKMYEYTPLQQVAAIVDWQGISSGDPSGIKRFYYDERGLKIAEAGVPRQSIDEKDQPITLIPLTYFGANAHGQSVLTIRFKSGTSEVTPDKCPLPILESAEDQRELTLFDARGLPIIKQDAEGSLTDFAFMPMRKVGCQKWKLTNLVMMSQSERTKPTTLPAGLESKRDKTSSTEKLIQPQPHLDEKRFIYDACERPTAVMVYRDNVLIETTQTKYDAFGQPVGEGPGDGTWPVYRRYNPAGWIWSANAEGVNTIFLHNLTGQDTVRLQSAATPDSKGIDLSQVTYSQLPSIASSSAPELERTQTVRDKGGRVYKKLRPAIAQTLQTAEEAPSIGLTLQVTKTGELTWPQPAEKTFSSMTLKIWPKGQPEQVTSLDIKPDAGRFHVDLKDKPAGIYQYRINYDLMNPFTRKPVGEDIFISTGEVQLDTQITLGSTTIAAIMKSDTDVRLIGKVENLIAIQLYQGEKKVGDPVPVTFDEKSSEGLADLKDQLSGIYTAQPVLSDGSVMPHSLAFTVYSAHRAVKPLSREFSCDVLLKTLREFGQIVWPINPNFPLNPIKISCEYTGEDDLDYTYQTQITYDTSYGKKQDSEGNEIDANIQFPQPVKSINSFSLFLQVDKEWIMILNKATNTINPPIRKHDKEMKIAEEDKDYVFLSTEPVPGRIMTFNYGRREIIYIAPLPGFDKPPSLQYKDTSTGSRSAEWKNIQCIDVTTNGVVLEASNMAPGCYPFTAEAKSKTSGFFYLVGKEGGTLYPAAEITASPTLSSKRLLVPTSPLSVRRYEYDAWDNITQETDALGNVTKSTYTDLNRLLQSTQPSITTLTEAGQPEDIAPVTSHGSNARGEGISTTDAYQHTSIIMRDTAGQSIMEVMADGALERQQIYDALGRVTRYRDDGRTDKIRWNYQWFDRLNRIIRSLTPKGKEARYTYTELGSRNSERDWIGSTLVYVFNPFGLVEGRFEPSGNIYTRMEYYPNSHQLRAQYNPDGTTLRWERDYFGHVIHHWDPSGAQFNYIYDQKWQVVKQTSIGGQHGTYMQVKKTTVMEVFNYQQVLYDRYVPTEVGVPGQNLSFTYNAGLLVYVRDDAHRRETYYGYDREFRRTSTEVHQLESDGSITLLRKATSSLNAWGLPEAMFDTDMALYTNYDRNGNRRHVSSYLYTTSQTPVLQSSLWMIYNAASQVLIDNGELTNGVIQPGQTGTAYEYRDVNGRSINLRSKEIKGGTQTLLDYDDDRILVGTHTADSSFVTESKFDPIDAKYPYGYLYRELRGSSETLRHETGFDINNWQRYEHQKSGGDETTTEYDLNPVGLTTQQRSKYPGGISDKLDCSYMYNGDTPQLAALGGTRHNEYGDGDYSSARQLYDANAVINAQLGVADKADSSKEQPVICFDTTYDGIIMRKMRMFQYPYASLIPRPPSSLVVDERIFTGVNGEYLGSYSITRDFNLSQYNTLLYYTQRDGATMRGGREVSSQTRGIHFDMLTGSIINIGVKSQQYINLGTRIINAIKPQVKFNMSLADIIQPASKSPLPTQYIVVAGDTFESIARKMGRNADFAGAIATQNHMVVTQPPVAGQKLQMPFFIDSHNSGTDYLSYSLAIQEISGNFYPRLSMHQPPRKHHSWWHDFIETVVSIATFVVALPVAGPIGASLIANIVSQGTAIALGDQHGFSFKSLAISGVEALVAGKMPLPSSITGNEIADKLIQKGMVAMADQLVEIGAGLRHSFDLKGVAIAIAAQATSMGLEVKGKVPFLASLDLNFTNSLLTSAINSAITHTPFRMEYLAAQALGTTVGMELGQASVEMLSAHSKIYASYLEAQTQPKQSTKSSKTLEQSSRKETTSSAMSRQTAKSPAIDRQHASLDEKLDAVRTTKQKSPDTTLDWTDAQARSSLQGETKSTGRSYLLNADRQERYRNMIFGSSMSKQSTETMAASLPAHEAAVSQQKNWWAVIERSASLASELATVANPAGLTYVGVNYAARDAISTVQRTVHELGNLKQDINLLKQRDTRWQGIKNLTSTGLDVVSLVPVGGVAGSAVRKMMPLVVRGAESVRVGEKLFSRELGMFGSTKASIIQKDTQSLSKHHLSGLSVDNVVRLVDEIGLETSRDQLILWSGLGRGNLGVKLSKEFAAKYGGTTLEMTPGGSWLEKMNLYNADSPFTRRQANEIWEKVSLRMINQASGQVRSVVGQVRADSIYFQERGALLMNKNVLGIDEINLKPRYIFGQ